VNDIIVFKHAQKWGTRDKSLKKRKVALTEKGHVNTAAGKRRRGAPIHCSTKHFWRSAIRTNLLEYGGDKLSKPGKKGGPGRGRIMEGGENLIGKMGVKKPENW